MDTSFSSKLRAELTRQDVGVKTLARRIDASNVDSVRRQLYKWLNEGVVPEQPSRDRVTDALGLERGALDPDDEEELQGVLVDLGDTLLRIAVIRRDHRTLVLA